MPEADAELSAFAAFAGRLADAARAETLPRFRGGAEVHNKAGIWFDPVTDADREAERLLRRLIAAVHPDHGIIGEEFGSHRPEAEWRWVLDPVDGTRAFVCGVASWATLIALERNGAPVLGVIDQPYTDERWIGHSGLAEFRRGQKTRACRASGVKDLKAARITTTDPRRTGYFTAAESEAFSALGEACKVARFSLDAYGYGLLALGEIDLVVEASLKRHDFSALVPIIEGAGGVITDWRGEPLRDPERGRVVAAANADLHAAALERLRCV